MSRPSNSPDDRLHIVWNIWRDITNPLAGGAEMYEHEVMNRLVERGHQVTAVVGGEVQDGSVDRAYTAVPNGSMYTQYLLAPHARRRSGRPDVILDGANGMPFFSPLTSRVPTVALVHHVHLQQWSDYFSPPIAHLGRFLERRAMPRVYRNTATLTCSDSTARDLIALGIPPEHIRVAPTGVHLPDDTDLRPEHPEPRFLSLGRLVPNKRLHLLLDVWEQVQPVIGGRLVIAGDGPIRAELEGRAVPGVDVLGRVSDETRDALLATSWFLVHTAKHEGWGLVITEAGGYRRPTLAFDVPGVRDAVVDGVTGMLVTSTDDFVRRWIDLARDGNRRAELGAAARERAASLDWETTTDAVESALTDVVAAHRRSGARVWTTVTRAPGAVPPDLHSRRGPSASSAAGPDPSAPIPLSIVVTIDPELDPERLRAAVGHLDAGHELLPVPADQGRGNALRAGVRRARGREILLVDRLHATTELEFIELVERSDNGLLLDAATAKVALRLSRSRGRSLDREIRHLLRILEPDAVQSEHRRATPSAPVWTGRPSLQISPRALLPYLVTAAATDQLRALVRVGDLVGPLGDRQIVVLPNAGHHGLNAVRRRLAHEGHEASTGFLNVSTHRRDAEALDVLRRLLPR